MMSGDDELRRRAEDMTRRSENRITAGTPDERASALEVRVEGLVLRRLADDPAAVRLSLGQSRSQPDVRYCVIRGTPAEALAVLRRALVALEQAQGSL